MISIKRLFKSFKYAGKGLIKVLKEEQNLKIQLMAGIVAVSLGAFFSIKVIEWIAIVLIIGLVLIMEILNSAVERVSDVLKPRISGYVKEIKDIMAAAVFLSSIMAVIVGLLIFIPYFVNFK